MSLASVASALALLYVFGADARPAAAQAAAAAVDPALAAGVVHTYFDAFRQQDAGKLVRVTRGPATEETLRMLDTLHQEARRRDVGVELRVRQLNIAPSAPGPGGTMVEAQFGIAVVARKWFFSKVARIISGRATFFVGKDLARGDEPRIVGLEMRFD